jgi:hypothetical protein
LLLEVWKAGRLDKAVPNLPIFQLSRCITGFDRQKRYWWPFFVRLTLPERFWERFWVTFLVRWTGIVGYITNLNPETYLLGDSPSTIWGYTETTQPHVISRP